MKIVALVLAGGEGTRLYPLTAEHAKPALPFASGYRIGDFVLANLVNSQISTIYVLAQYKPDSLMRHVAAAWAPWVNESNGLIKVLLPRSNRRLFRGTADAVHQYLDLLQAHSPDLVAVFAADHVYRMDVRQMVAFHRARKADVTLAAVAVLLEGQPVPRLDDDRMAEIVATLQAEERMYQNIDYSLTITTRQAEPEDQGLLPGEVTAEETRRVFRARVVNPRWIEAMRRHGYKGAFELAATVDFLFGYDATAGAVDDWMYASIADSYVFDEDTRRFLSESNPWALRGMTERLLEAAERGLWHSPDPEMLRRLRETYLELEGDLEDDG
jgi:choline kinase